MSTAEEPSREPMDPRARRVAEAVPAWRHELAELGGRNTLLWHRDLPSGTLELTVAHPAGVAKLLSGHTTRLSELVREPVAYAEAARRARAIRGKVVELHEEHGLATGFIAVGMASWHLPGATVPPRAPVLLRTCALEPTDASYRDFTVDLGPDVEFNPVLEHYLRVEQGIHVDGAELARRSNVRYGFDPRPAYDALQRQCASIEAFSIGAQLVIGTYPWAKLSMVADVAAQAGTLHEHDIIAALAGDTRARRTVGRYEPVTAGDTDPRRELNVLDADASQQAAVDAAADGAHLVVEGPPGTGKSQTIANMAATLIGQGRSVLVVAEKQVALQTVRRRLDHVGLAGMVLDVREDATGRHQVADAVAGALARLDDEAQTAVGAPQDGAGDDPVDTVLAHRRRMRAHHDSLHGEREPWGVSVLQAQQALTELSTRPRPPASRVRLEPPVLRALGRERLARLGETLREAARLGAWTPGKEEDPWYAAHLTSEDDAARALTVVQHLSDGELTAARERMRSLATDAGLPEPVTLEQWGDQLGLMDRVRETLDVFRPQIYDAPLEDLVAATAGRAERRAQRELTMVARNRLRRQARDLLRPGRPPADLHARLVAARDQRAEWEQLAGRAARPQAPTALEDNQEALAAIRGELDWLAEVLKDGPLGGDLDATHLDRLLELLRRLAQRQDRLEAVPRAYGLVQELRGAGLGPVVDDLARRGADPDDVPGELEFVWWTSLLADVAEQDPLYGEHDGDALRAQVRGFIEADRRHLAANAERLRQQVQTRTRQALAAHPGQARVLRERLVDTSRPRSLREVLPAAAEVLRALVPCWVMSPLVAGLVLPPGRWFDAVIIDEASRVPVAHAIPAISRSDQVIVVGDRQQLPPRSFVNSVDQRQEQAAEETPAGQEGTSVLEALHDVLPVHRLETHYRCLDERLVQPVNAELHGGRLATFPGVLAGQVLRHEVVKADGVSEVDRVVQLVLQHARARPAQSLGVITLDQARAEEIDLALRTVVTGTPDLIGSFRENALERFFVKPVGRVQGDVRDVILLCLGGRSGEPTLGPFARPDGHRWAGVALTRSRRRTVVVSGSPLPPRGAAAGADLLRTALADAAAPAPGVHPPTPLVADLARRLRAEQLVVHEGYGRGGRRIELAVEDPARPGRPLVAIETDGVPWAPAANARERDRLRMEQLTRLGWTHVRVWSTDLFRDPARDVARVVAAVREASAAGDARG